MKTQSKKTIWKHLLYWSISLYALFCIGIYLTQERMLFPAYAAMPVVSDWQPNAGIQTFLTGQCGKLHVAKWPIANAKGAIEKGTVMVFHGNAESLASVEYQVQRFHALGYSVMAWDYAGYGQSADCWSNEQGFLQDAETAYTWLAKQNTLPIVVYGRSVGSGLAVYIASKHSVQKLLLVSPYDSLTNVASENMPSFVPVRLILRFPLAATQWISQVKAPIYAIHGLADSIIKPARAAALFKHKELNTHIEWVKDVGHEVDSAAQFEPWLANALK